MSAIERRAGRKRRPRYNVLRTSTPSSALKRTLCTALVMFACRSCGEGGSGGHGAHALATPNHHHENATWAWNHARRPAVLHRPTISEMMEFVNRNEPFVMRGWLDQHKSAWSDAAAVGDLSSPSLLRSLLAHDTRVPVRRVRQIECTAEPFVVDSPEVLPDVPMTIAEYIDLVQSVVSNRGRGKTREADTDADGDADGDAITDAGTDGDTASKAPLAMDIDALRAGHGAPDFDPAAVTGRPECTSWHFEHYLAQQPVSQFRGLADIVPDVFGGASVDDSPYLYLHCGAATGRRMRTRLHWDFAENLHFVLSGRKRFVMWDAITGASTLSGDMNKHGNKSPIDIMDTMARVNGQFPAFKLAAPLAWGVELLAGDALYIPMFVCRLPVLRAEANTPN